MNCNPIISVIIILEIVGFWIILFYNHDREVYLVNLIVGAGLMLMMVDMMGWASLLLLIMIIPFLGGYLRILSSIMGGMSINESVNKILTLMVVILMGSLINELGYALSFMFIGGSILSGVLCGVYVFICLGVGMWVILLLYIVPNVSINDNYRLLTLGVIPLLAFFVKICSSWILLWIVMINAMILIV